MEVKQGKVVHITGLKVRVIPFKVMLADGTYLDFATAVDVTVTDNAQGYIRVKTSDSTAAFTTATTADAGYIYLAKVATSNGVVVNLEQLAFTPKGFTDVNTPSTLQTLAAGGTILANANSIRVVGSGAARTLTSTPTIADGVDGQVLTIFGTDATNTVTLQDSGTLASSNLKLQAAARTLALGDVLVLRFDSTASLWYEVSFSSARWTAQATQTLAAGTAILANDRLVKVAGDGAAVILTGTPTIADGVAGQLLLIAGTDDTNTVTLQDQGLTASTNLELGAPRRTLANGDYIWLIFDATGSVWREIAFSSERLTTQAVQTLAAGTAIVANDRRVRVVGSGGAVTSTAAPTIADGVDGQVLIVEGTHDTNTITLSDVGTLPSSNLRLGDTTRVLAKGETLTLMFDGTDSLWYELSYGALV